MAQPLQHLLSRSDTSTSTISSPLAVLKAQLKADLARLHDRIFDLQLSDDPDELDEVEGIIQELTLKLNFLQSISIPEQLSCTSAA